MSVLRKLISSMSIAAPKVEQILSKTVKPLQPHLHHFLFFTMSSTLLPCSWFRRKWPPLWHPSSPQSPSPMLQAVSRATSSYNPSSELLSAEWNQGCCCFSFRQLLYHLRLPQAVSVVGGRCGRKLHLWASQVAMNAPFLVGDFNNWGRWFFVSAFGFFVNCWS